MGKLKDVFKVDKPIIGMVHLRPLPGSPKYDPVNMGMDKIISIALEEAAILEQAGVDGVQVENMWDIPICAVRISDMKPPLPWQLESMRSAIKSPFRLEPNAT